MSRKQTVKKRVKPGLSQQAAHGRRLAFVAEYLSNGQNALQAAKAVGFSAKTAYQQGSRLLKNVEVQELIAKAAARAAEEAQLTVNKTLREIARLAFNDPRKLFDDSNRLIDLKNIDDDTAAAIQSVEVFEEYSGRGENREAIGQTKKIKLHPKTQALDMLCKHLALYAAEKRELSGNLIFLTQAEADAAREDGINRAGDKAAKKP